MTRIGTTTDTFYIDQAHTVLSGSCEPGLTLKKAFYYSVAVDRRNQKSSASSAVGFGISCGPGEITEKAAFRDGVEEKNKNLPDKFSLEANFPNPFNPVTNIKYALPEDVFVTLKIYDVLGKEIITLVNEYQYAGYKEVRLDVSNLPSGVYFYKIVAGSFINMKKMMLMK